jgi:hypothetical protein
MKMEAMAEPEKFTSTAASSLEGVQFNTNNQNEEVVR